MIQAQNLRQYLAYRTHRAVNGNELDEAATLAEVNGMQGLQAQAVYVRSLLEPNGDTSRSAESIALALSFSGLPALFPT